MKAIQKKFKKTSVTVDGSVTGDKRQDAIDLFQDDDDILIFNGQFEAAGEGVDGLQNVCSNILFVEYPWQPGLYLQACDRLHRMGQDNAVMIYNSIVSGTIEEKFVYLLEEKARNFNAVIDGVDIDDAGMFKDLLRAA